MGNKTRLITTRVGELVEPVLEDMGFELVDVEFLSERGRWVLRLYTDKEGGVTIDDCARVSGEIGHLIDVKGIIDHEYVLEVSSPGLNRPLKKERDFAGAMDKKIKVKMAVPVEGRRNFTGYLRDYKDKTLYMETDLGLTTLPWSGIEKAHLIYEFS